MRRGGLANMVAIGGWCQASVSGNTAHEAVSVQAPPSTRPPGRAERSYDIGEARPGVRDVVYHYTLWLIVGRIGISSIVSKP